MAPLRVQVAAVAAMVAVQLNIPGSLASTEQANNSLQENNPVTSPSFPSFLGGGAFGDLEKLFQQSLSLFSGFGSLGGMFRAEGSPLSLTLPEGDDSSCQIKVKAGNGASLGSGVKLGLDVNGRMLHATFHHQERQKNEEDGKKRSFLEQSVHMSSSMALPERCVATAGVLMAGFGGILVNQEESEGLLVLPSQTLLKDGVESGDLPEGVIGALESGDQAALKGLTEQQQCRAAGFTDEQCTKLGGRKPAVASVPPADGSNLPIPVLDVPLDALN